MVAWRPLFLCALCAPALLPASSARAESLGIRVQIFPFTGEVRFQNRNNVPFPMTSYSIASASGALNGANGVWTSITDTYDENGNGFIAPTTLWQETSTTANFLAENSSTGFAGVLPPLRTVSLGKIWNPNSTPIPDLVFMIHHSPTEQALVDLRRAVDGDYNDDREVDAEDYAMWEFAYGSQAGPSFVYFADGNIDGVVDAADYTVWRNNVGLSLPSLPAAGSGGIAEALVVPEPACGWLLMTGAMLAALQRKSRIGPLS